MAGVNPPRIRPAVARVAQFAPLPPEDVCTVEFIHDLEDAVVDLPTHVTDLEAEALLEVLETPDDSSYYGLLWVLVHAVETAPTWPHERIWRGAAPWIVHLRKAATNAGHSPPTNPASPAN